MWSEGVYELGGVAETTLILPYLAVRDARY